MADYSSRELRVSFTSKLKTKNTSIENGRPIDEYSRAHAGRVPTSAGLYTFLRSVSFFIEVFCIDQSPFSVRLGRASARKVLHFTPDRHPTDRWLV